MKISLVAAIAENFAIGKNNQLLWHLPNDLKFFKSYTLGKVIVMGRNTFESIGKRALPGRVNVVVTRDASIRVENVLVFKSLSAVLEHFKNSEEICIVGGAKMYAETLSLADLLILTRVEVSPEADVFFPEINWNNWKLVSEEKHEADEKHAYNYTFQIFERKRVALKG
jgi:dihydrofolate reductase